MDCVLTYGVQTIYKSQDVYVPPRKTGHCGRDGH